MYKRGKIIIDEQTIRNELAIAIKDLRARGTRETPPEWSTPSGEDAMDDNDIINMQMANRQLWIDKLSFSGFFYSFSKKILKNST